MHYARTLTLVAFVMIGSLLALRAEAEQRTWRDQTGKFSLEAEFVEIDGEQVKLRTDKGKEVMVPLEKLSQDDQDFLADYLDQQDADKGIRLTVTRFFNALRKGEEKRDDAIRETITSKAREKLEGSGSGIKNLAKPDRSTKTAVRTVSIDGDTAEATVRMRLQGKSIRPRVLLRKEEGQWLVYGLVGPNNEEEETTILFEDAASSSSSSEVARATERAAGDEDMEAPGELARAESGPHPEELARAAKAGAKKEEPDHYAVPEGDAQDLMKFLDRLAAGRPPRGVDESEHQVKVNMAIETAADRVLADHAASQEDKQAMAGRLIAALLELRKSEPEKYTAKLADLPDELGRRELTAVMPDAQSAVLLVQLDEAAGTQEVEPVKQAIDAAMAHLPDAPSSPLTLQLASLATHSAEQVGDEFAAQTYASVADLFAKSADEEMRQVGETMAAKSRRMQLLGSEMVVTGVSPKGERFNFADYQGKVVLVDFWATWCEPCMEEMPNFRKLYAEYHDRGFEVVGISVDNHMEKLAQYLSNEKFPWTILADYHPRNKDALSEHYGVDELPQTILIGADGRVISLNARGEDLTKQLAALFGDEA